MLCSVSGDVDVDLGGLTKLKSLDLDLDQDWELSGLLAVLRRLPSNSCLHTLGLLRYSVSAKDERIFKEFDAAITAMDVMHSLHRVEIRVETRRPTLDIETMRSYFPILASKGWLFVYCECRLSNKFL
jgi:hypothetical protein